jgi:hypothetical protein
VDNASNLYDEMYIEKMNNEKIGTKYDIIPNIDKLQDYYNNNFDRLGVINFLTFYCNDYNDMKYKFINCNKFTKEDNIHFINPFIDIMDNEKIFYFDYWEKIHNQNEELRHEVENYISKELNKYTLLFDYFKKSSFCIFSYSITRNGRGFNGLDSNFSALIGFPKSINESIYSFLLLLHEYTHQFTDELVQTNINMNDGSHDLSENIVVLTDYYLIKALDENLLQEYIYFFSGNNVDENEFKNIYKISTDIKLKIDELINKIINIV